VLNSDDVKPVILIGTETKHFVVLLHLTKDIFHRLKITYTKLYTPDVSKATAFFLRYGLDGPGIEFRWRRDIPHPSRPALGPTQPLINGYQVFPPSSDEVKERVELYLYSTSGPSWPVTG